MLIRKPNYETSAQEVTAICYNEENRNLGYRIKCKDLKDLMACVSIIKSYNDFDEGIVNENLMKYAGFKKYYNPDNPNNGKDLLEFEIGRESSPVMYIRYYAFSSPIQYQENGEIKDFTKELFETNMKRLADFTGADECDFEEENLNNVCRLWWD